MRIAGGQADAAPEGNHLGWMIDDIDGASAIAS